VVSIISLLNKVVDIRRNVADYDDMGGVQYTLTTYSASNPCRISSSVPSEVSTGPTQYAEATVMIYILPGLDVMRDDQVVDGSTIYEVLGVRDPSVDDHHTALVCKVQTDGA
jgi:hypothetical protein